ncbi:MAG: hypothetical protein RIQ33_716 [Bacteroidota bacterium]
MKIKLFVVLVLCVAAFGFNACTEIGPPIDLTPETPPVVGAKKSGLISDTTYTETTIPAADVKHILMEEFSGQKCTNCPSGKYAIKQIMAANLGKISSVTLHTNVFAPLSDPIAPVDFRTSFATEISNNYGNGIGIPCAMVNRVLFSGQTARAMTTPSTWAGFVTSELSKTSYVNIKLNSIWDETIMQDSVSVELHFANAAPVNDSINLTVMLIEDKIEAPQDSSGIEVEHYEHENILRTMLTNSSGVQIKGAKTAGNVKRYEFRTDVIDAKKWNINNLKLVAFVNKQNAGNYEVIQVAEIKLK